MATDDRTPPQQLGHTVAEISEKASVLVREEIELAKAEITQKATRLGKGAGVAAVAGVFAVFGLLFLLHTLAWLLFTILPVDDVFWGYLIVTILLFAGAGIAAMVGVRWIKRSTPPTPDMAIDEAKRIRETVSS